MIYNKSNLSFQTFFEEFSFYFPPAYPGSIHTKSRAKHAGRLPDEKLVYQMSRWDGYNADTPPLYLYFTKTVSVQRRIQDFDMGGGGGVATIQQLCSRHRRMGRGRKAEPPPPPKKKKKKKKKKKNGSQKFGQKGKKSHMSHNIKKRQNKFTGKERKIYCIFDSLKLFENNAHKLATIFLYILIPNFARIILHNPS